MFRRLAAVTAAAAGALALCASPAVASPTVNWKPVDTNSSWDCPKYVAHQAYKGVWGGLNFKTCIVTRNVGKNGHAQAVLVVQNATRHDVYLEKGRIVFQSAEGGDVWCAPTNLAVGATAGCYGPLVDVLDCNRTTRADTELTTLGRKQGDFNTGADAPC
ncbi:hypothetical protein [Streptomyces sp. URMC 123]|uniref:hypothetical protein n=1 Tax=Streptomyces sp. URMC 123 TaxID=3423403 RepID=UPI003F1BDA47